MHWQQIRIIELIRVSKYRKNEKKFELPPLNDVYYIVLQYLNYI